MEANVNQNFWDELENASRQLGNYTLFVIFKEAFPEEYALHLSWHEQEWNVIQNRVERQLILERKKTVLFAELEALEQ